MDSKEKRNKIIKVVIISLVLLLSSVSLYRDNFITRGKLIITVFNVGQGDSILIKTPNRKKVLIDGGPNSSVMEKIPYDFPFFTCNFDIVVSTHSHEDHLEGLKSVLKRCRVTALVLNDPSSPLIPLLKDGKIILAYSGDEFSLDGVDFKVIWPGSSYKASDINDFSMVLFMQYKDYKALFAGDSETKDYLMSFNEDIDFLKVPHHGSYDESLNAFLEKAKPEIMAISVGKNSFGHPSEKVLGIANKFGVKVFRTDINGDIFVSIDSWGNSSY